MKLPGWPPRDGRAFIALAFSILGAAVLTGLVAWLIAILREFGRADPARREQVISALANSNYGLLAIIGAILLSLGLAINRRSFKGSAFGASFEASGGPDEDKAAATALSAASDALSDKADEIQGGSNGTDQ